MIWTSDHAAERYIERGRFKLDVEKAKIHISSSIAKWEEAIKFFGEAVVAIPKTKLKAVCFYNKESDNVVVITVTDSTHKTTRGKDDEAKTLRKSKSRYIRTMGEE